MDLVTLVIILLVVGVVLYLINYLIVLPPPIKMILNVIIAVALVLWLLYSLGGANFRVGR